MHYRKFEHNNNDNQHGALPNVTIEPAILSVTIYILLNFYLYDYACTESSVAA